MTILTSFRVALAAIISHTVVTVIALVIFFYDYFLHRRFTGLLAVVLLYSLVTVVLHMLYRKRERSLGTTFQDNKGTLLTHIVSSCAALLVSFFVLLCGMNTSLFAFGVFVWLLSLVTGIHVFLRKYKGEIANILKKR